MAVLFNYLLVSVAVVVFFWFSLSRIGVTFDFSFIGKYQVRIWDGFVMTVQLSIVSLLISLAIGVCCAVGQNSRILFLRSLLWSYGYIRTKSG